MNERHQNQSSANMRKTKPQPYLVGPARGIGAFIRFCQTIQSLKQRDALLLATAELIPQLFAAQGGVVVLQDVQTHELYVPAASIDDIALAQRLKSIRIKMEATTSLNAIFLNGAPLATDFRETLPIELQVLQEQFQNWTSNRLAVPLQTNGSVVGALLAINKIKGDFTTEDAQLLCAVSGVTEMALAAIDAHQQWPAPDDDAQAFNPSKNRAAHHLSHAIKTPLAVSIASLKLLEKHLKSSHRDGWQTIFQRAQRNLERLLTVEYEMEDILRQGNDGAGKEIVCDHDIARCDSGSLPDSTINTCEAALSTDTCDDSFFRQVNIEFLVHELKAPVSIIESGVRLLLEKQSPNAPLTSLQQRTIERVLRNTHKTRDMLGGLLEVGRAQASCFHCQPFSPLPTLSQILITVVEAGNPELYNEMKNLKMVNDQLAFLARHGIRLDASLEAEHMTMEQDQIKFSQIAGNLLHNGFYYHRRHLLIYAARQQAFFTLAVRDDGPGIAPNHHETIFQRYKQILPNEGIARSGHGLGLAMARILARSMGGDIVVESELGQGALFRLHLPKAFPSPDSS